MAGWLVPSAAAFLAALRAAALWRACFLVTSCTVRRSPQSQWNGFAWKEMKGAPQQHHLHMGCMPTESV